VSGVPRVLPPVRSDGQAWPSSERAGHLRYCRAFASAAVSCAVVVVPSVKARPSDPTGQNVVLVHVAGAFDRLPSIKQWPSDMCDRAGASSVATLGGDHRPCMYQGPSRCGPSIYPASRLGLRAQMACQVRFPADCHGEVRKSDRLRRAAEIAVPSCRAVTKNVIGCCGVDCAEPGPTEQSDGTAKEIRYS